MLFTNALLKESSLADTIHDWIFHPHNGFLRYWGKMEEFLGVYHKLNPIHPAYHIPFFKYKNYILIRFPLVAIFSLVGATTGLYGAIAFNKLYNEKHQTPSTSLLYFVLSHSFFTTMNVSGLLYHCILPKDVKWRYLFRYLDQICTGIAGSFMAFAFQSIVDEINNKNIILYQSKQHNTIKNVIGFCTILPMIHPIFGDMIYIGGLLLSAVNVLKCYWKLKPYDDEGLVYLRKMSFGVLSALVMVGVTVLGDKHITLWSDGAINLMRSIYIFADFGYMFTAYYGTKYYSKLKMN